MKPIFLAFAAVIAFASSSGAARAETETWLVPLSASLSGVGGDSNFTYSMPLFNQHGGTRALTAVEITGSAMFATSTQAFNGDVLPYTITVPYSAGFTASLPSGVISAFQSGTSSQPSLVPNTFATFSFVLDAPISANVGAIGAFSALNGGDSIQTGTFSAGLTLPPVATISWSTPSQLMGVSLSITYTYEVVPAPASAMGILTFGLVVRQRRR